MADTGSITISGSVTGDPGGGKTIAPPTISSANAAMQRLIQTLASGDNTITIPTNALSCIITPAAGNIVALKLKGAGGDTGILISKTLPTLLCFDTTPPASFIINAASIITGLCEFDFM